ncbi:hypothetical protein BY458DRAFT_430813 [Sporodiniella umbellata]|nr:hypothetical protein BY458DRAFT_430813 [Sporodiniella umbellata]
MTAQKNTRQKNKKKEVVEEDAENLCFICTEPMITFAVTDCEHRTCHICALRLRALYKTHNCTYCKAEETTAIFTNKAEKAFSEFTEDDTPFADKKLSIKFETSDMHKDAMNIMKYNCPAKGCTECCNDWTELKLHVRKEHDLNLCDLCIAHKKAFPSEHILYTNNQLTEHHSKGDRRFLPKDETGFSGHPECHFCKTRFFDNDALYIHCRDNHEQCFLCVREGIRHEYFVNYSSLEDHFRKDHYMCLYPNCLEKKFIVFKSPIDLVAHEAEVHRGNTSGLQRSAQTESRRVELNFQYESFRQTRNNDNRRQKQNNNGSGSGSNSSSTNNTAISANDFPKIQGSNINSARTVPGAPIRKKGKQKSIQKPDGFGDLSDRGSSSSGTNTPRTANQNDSNLTVSHAAFLAKLEETLQSKPKVAEFRKATGDFRRGTVTANVYVETIVNLCQGNAEKAGKIFKGVENLIDLEEKKLELVKAWRNKHTSMSQFPALEIKSRTPSNKPSRVLVIKNQHIKTVDPKSPWKKPTEPSPTSKDVGQSSTLASSQTSKEGSNVKKKNANKPALEANLFPSLPTSAPKHQEVLDIRRGTYRPNHNPWSGATEQEEGEGSVGPSVDKKKKGRKNKVLLRVGL